MKARYLSLLFQLIRIFTVLSLTLPLAGPARAALASPGREGQARTVPVRESGPFMGPAIPLAPDPRSVDAVVVFAGEDIRYSFYGHQPVEPTAANPAANWDWWTLAGTPTAAVAATAPNDLHSRPDVAYSREGYAVVVWDEGIEVDTINCTADPANPIPEPRSRGDIRFRRLNVDPVGGSAWGALGTVAAGQPDHILHDPSIAIDSNGRGLAIWVHTRVVRDSNNCFDHLEKRLEYKVWTGAGWGALGTLPASGAYAVTPCPPNTVPVPGERACQHYTDIAFTARKVGNPAAAQTRQQAIAVWNEYKTTVESTCTPPPGQGDPFQIPHFIFWPNYAVWNGDSFGAPADVAGGPVQGPTDFSSAPYPQLSKQGISGDQRENAELTFPILRETALPFPDCVAFENEVWTARWNGGNAGQNWSSAAMLVTDRYGADVAFYQAAGVTPPGPDDKALVAYHTGWATRGPGQDWLNRVPNIASGTGTPSVAALAHDRVLTVWFDDGGGLKWSQMDRITETWSAPGDLGIGYFPELAAVTGSPSLPRAEWTWLEYYAGDSLAGHVQQVRDDTEDVGSTAMVNLASLYEDGAANAAYQYHKLDDRTTRRNIGGLNFGASNTMRDFVAWGAEHYPADRYLLKLNDHGRAWHGSCDDTAGGNHDHLRMDELTNDLTAAGRRFDLVVFHACTMASMEGAYALAAGNQADFMVASEENMPARPGGNGIRNDHVLDGLPAQGGNPQIDGLIDTPHLADSDFASRFVAIYQRDNVGVRDYTLSAIDLGQIPGLFALVSDFARRLNAAAAIPGDLADIRTARNEAEFMRGRGGFGFNLVDLRHFAQRIDANFPEGDLLDTAADAVINGLAVGPGNVIIANWTDGRPNANGLSIWLQRHRRWVDGADSQVNDGTGAGANNTRLALYQATTFDQALPGGPPDRKWSSVVRDTASSSGINLILESDSEELYLQFQNPSGESIGDPSTGELCGGYCGGDLVAAECSWSSGKMIIFVPEELASGIWVVNGTDLSGPATYTLRIQTIVHGVLATETINSGSVNPGEILSGPVSYQMTGYTLHLPVVIR